MSADARVTGLINLPDYNGVYTYSGIRNGRGMYFHYFEDWVASIELDSIGGSWAFFIREITNFEPQGLSGPVIASATAGGGAFNYPWETDEWLDEDPSDEWDFTGLFVWPDVPTYNLPKPVVNQILEQRKSVSNFLRLRLLGQF